MISLLFICIVLLGIWAFTSLSIEVSVYNTKFKKVALGVEFDSRVSGMYVRYYIDVKLVFVFISVCFVKYNSQ